MRKLSGLIVAAILTLSACGSSNDDGNRASVINRFCLPGSDGQMWEHVDLSDGRTGVPTGDIC